MKFAEKARGFSFFKRQTTTKFCPVAKTKLRLDDRRFDFSEEDISGKSEQYDDQIRLDAIRTLKRFPPSKREKRVFSSRNGFFLQIIPKPFDTICKTN